MTAKLKESLPVIGPTQSDQRIISLDVLRGFAILGILLVNIEIFSMLRVTERNPTAFGDLSGLNYIIAMLTDTLAWHKFLTLFTMLFGAGILLMAKKIEAKGGNPLKRHYSRMLWLLVIGNLHLYLLWDGDVLVPYALCGSIAFLCRKLSPKKLLVYGLLMFSVITTELVIWQVTIPGRSEASIKRLEQYWQPTEEQIDETIALYRGDWTTQVADRVRNEKWYATSLFFFTDLLFWLSRMLIGMALLKWGILNAKAPAKTFRKLLFFGLGIGLAISAAGWLYSSMHDWDVKYSIFNGYLFRYWGSVVLAMGYIGGIILILQAGKLKRLTRWLSAVGRMAFTNYLMQSIICTAIFYGFGLGLFGKVERTGQLLIVLAVWIFQLWYSTLWLKHFRFGPAEWLWRSLSYWKRQPMKIKKITSS